MENMPAMQPPTPTPQPAAPAHPMQGSVMDVQPPRHMVAAPQPPHGTSDHAPAAPESATPESAQTIPSSEAQPVLHDTAPASEPAEPQATAPEAAAPESPVSEPASAANPASAVPVGDSAPEPASAPAEPAAPAKPTDPPAEGGVVPAPPDDAPTGAAPADAAKPAADAKAKNPMAIASVPMKPHKRIPIGAFIAVAVGCALIGLAVLVYTEQSKSATGNNKTSAQSEPNVTTQPITAADVDTAVSEIDKSMNDLSDTADFAASDLSDATLELQ